MGDGDSGGGHRGNSGRNSSGNPMIGSGPKQQSGFLNENMHSMKKLIGIFLPLRTFWNKRSSSATNWVGRFWINKKHFFSSGWILPPHDVGVATSLGSEIRQIHGGF